MTGQSSCQLAFCASTGRTATTFLAKTLNRLPRVVGLHEGYLLGEPPVPRLPLINFHARRAWHDESYAQQIAAEMRGLSVLREARGSAQLLVDVAFNNAPLMVPLARLHPGAQLFVMFRRCESFVRSATIMSGEDQQPAGWPDSAKDLTDREKFISLGRLKPATGSDDAQLWPSWSAIQKNIWLWHHVNSHLLEISESLPNCNSLFFEDLVAHPEHFWTDFLRKLQRLDDPALSVCVGRSGHKINQRDSYQVGPVERWSDSELALYDHLARPLEKMLYEKRA